IKQLRGFERVALAPGQKKSVTFTLGLEELQLLDSDMHWVVVPGTFDLMIGKSSADIALQGSLEVKDNGSKSAFVDERWAALSSDVIRRGYPMALKSWFSRGRKGIRDVPV